MNRTRLLATTALVFTLIIFVFTIGEYLALHDIANDYVSKDVVEALQVSSTNAFPDWTETRGEWRTVNISGFSRIGFLIFNVITLALCIRALKPNAYEDVEG